MLCVYKQGNNKFVYWILKQSMFYMGTSKGAAVWYQWKNGTSTTEPQDRGWSLIQEWIWRMWHQPNWLVAARKWFSFVVAVTNLWAPTAVRYLLRFPEGVPFGHTNHALIPHSPEMRLLFLFLQVLL